MANARLHIICGNCGCNDMFVYEVVRDGADITKDKPEFKDAVHIWCKNCSTLHDLEDTVDELVNKGVKR